MPGNPNWQHNVLFADPTGVPNLDASYDYVIIGGGTGGLAIAARLAEDPSTTVAVVEAGGFYETDNGIGSVIPALAPAQTASTNPNFTAPLIDWGFVSTPGPGINGRRLHYARGKTLGGCSALNFMAYNRGTKGAYQAWADKIGDQSYSWENFLPYFKKSATLTLPDHLKRQPDGSDSVLYDQTVFDNTLDGPLQVSWPNWATRSGNALLDAMAKAGIDRTDAFDNGSLIGSAWSASTIDPKNSHRSSSKTAYLDRALEKSDIKVYTQTRAEKILFDGTTAVDVLVNTDGQTYKLHANKEIILAAGAIQSPQLLMVSGIGPRETLEKHNIPIIAPMNGVGKNLQDHILFGISHRVSVETASKIMSDPTYAQKVTADYTTTASGPLTTPHGPLAFEKITNPALTSLSPSTLAAIAHFPPDWPELEYLSIDTHISDLSNLQTSDPKDGHNYFTLLTALMTNLSRGSISISSASTADPPLIDLGYLTHPAEMDLAIHAFKRLRCIWDNVGELSVGGEFYPGRDAVRTDDDEGIAEFVKGNVAPVWHAAGTCAMGKLGDVDAVVDSKARVFGTKGLRVVDASVFPLLPPCHPQGTVYALAEKIADDVKAGR